MSVQQPTFSFEEQTPSPFHFESTARAHGWVALRPFAWHAPAAELSRVHQLTNGQVMRLGMREGQLGVQVGVTAAEPLPPEAESEIRQAVRRMLRLDEDLTEFYHLGAQMNGHRLHLQPGAGRLLRCPNLFEDMIYTICTINITWTGTIRLIDRLTELLGAPFPGRPEWRAFPTPAAIATAGPDFLKQEIRLGYRSPYVWELATAVAEGRLDLQTFEDPSRPTGELVQLLRQIKGIGPYAAATLLMILGRYEHLAIDTELRAFVSRKYYQGQPVTDAQIRAIYTPWGRWQYLAYWFDEPPV